MRLALLQILQDLMEGFLMVPPARRLALAALLVYGLPYLLTEFLSHLPEQPVTAPNGPPMRLPNPSIVDSSSLGVPAPASCRRLGGLVAPL